MKDTDKDVKNFADKLFDSINKETAGHMVEPENIDNEKAKSFEQWVEKTRKAFATHNVRQNAFAVYPDSVGFDLANENTLMAVFRTEELANKFGEMMWGTMFYVEPIDSPHFV
jgi:hypothetical protein